MYSVPLAADRSENRARNQAEYVAGLPNDETEVEATVLYVYPSEDYKGAPPHDFAEIDAAVAAADQLEAAGVSVNRVVDGGEVATKILAHADDVDAENVVLGGRRRSCVAKVVMGSIAMDVIVSAERPVTVTG